MKIGMRTPSWTQEVTCGVGNGPFVYYMINTLVPFGVREVNWANYWGYLRETSSHNLLLKAVAHVGTGRKQFSCLSQMGHIRLSLVIEPRDARHGQPTSICTHRQVWYSYHPTKVPKDDIQKTRNREKFVVHSATNINHKALDSRKNG